MAFITCNSNLVHLLEGLCSSNLRRFEFSNFLFFAGIEPTTSGFIVPRSDELSWFYIVSNFVVGNRGLVVESDFYTKLKKLDVQEGKKDKLFADHVTQVCEAHDWVILSFLQQVQGFARPTTEGLRKNIGHNLHV